MENEELKVLLAEDDKNLGAVLKAYLEAKGYHTTLCINGKEAFDIFNKKKIDFCILDVMMPVKDGFTLAQEIRRLDKQIPILFLTAKSLQEDTIKGFTMIINGDVDEYPESAFNLVGTIEEAIEKGKKILSENQ